MREKAVSSTIRTALVSKQDDLFGDSRTGLPAGLTYVLDFITPEEEAKLLAAIGELPLQEARYKIFTARRRVMSYGGYYDFDKNQLAQAPPLPPFLEPLRNTIADWLDLPAEQFGHALIAEYRPGTPLGWHRDAPNFAFVVGVSLGAECRMRFRPYPPGDNKETGFELNLQPRSVYVLRDDARWRWQHSIPPTKALRYSITFRTLRERASERGTQTRKRLESPGQNKTRVNRKTDTRCHGG